MEHREISECALNKFHKRYPHYILMFGWVQACRNILPTVSIKESIVKFIIYYNTDDDAEKLEVTYHRMVSEFREAERG